ncbi:MAG: extracellular solute-binding protein [Gemmatimonadota bacterium]|nr:extracellular solute-binding protein [Gemmatimonadota bacterium]
MTRRRRPPGFRPTAWVVACVAVAACGGAEGGDTDGAVELEVWYHAGQPGERTALEAQAARFNALQDSIRVSLTFLPEGSYNAQVQASAVADRLPDLLDLDGPYIATYAWQGHIRALDDLLPDSVRRELLPSIVAQGEWRGSLYGVGTFDSGLALYADARALAAVEARIPRSPGEAWSRAELDDLLERLAARDPDGAVLDLKLNYDGEWFTYAFQPALRSAGGGLLDTTGERPAASGILNGPGSVSAVGALRSWMMDGLVDPNLDDAAFVRGRVALSWSGHWDHPRYREALGDDLLVLPLPDFGRGTRTGQGSWVWTIPGSTEHPEAAAAFLSYLLEPEQVLEMTDANGAVPGTRAAAAASTAYREGGPLHLLLRQLEEGWSVPRPQTPAYPFASSIFQDAFEAVRNGEDVTAVLDEAARTIDREIDDNHGFLAP